MTPDELFPQVYGKLRKLAAGKLAHERGGHTLDATVLAHEAWLKLGADSFTSRSRFYKRYRKTVARDGVTVWRWGLKIITRRVVVEDASFHE